jgi:hypothetical protein
MAEGNTDHNMESTVTDGSESSETETESENETESQFDSRNPNYWQSGEKLDGILTPKLILVPTHDGLGIHEWRSLEIIKTEVRHLDRHVPRLIKKINSMERNLAKKKKQLNVMLQRKMAYVREMDELFLIRRARLVSTSEAASTSKVASSSHE